ncbi:GH1 family beta-glucosidase [Nocardioides terrisoli]|uniref:GH1 family beta-glucosidase n=1 Tax=Nocardioides terrisoli TaxID=3388267 RepID=UPI00287B7592|nr:GH1 family beta-glucosidase [Nocardioides marmorisolisilvae]
MTSSFPEGFRWGVASASYQIEGAVAADGRGPSIWDTFSHTPGRIDGDDDGDVACDHYHRWAEDLDLIRSLGIPAYRFSVAWPRVMPDGRTVNQAGLDFYDRLVDGMLERGIDPLLTLYHWDLPQALDVGEAGGWLDRDIADRFADFAVVVGKQLGDRVPAITTLNEPWCSAYLGYAKGEHAPGRTSSPLAYRAAHHLNLAHGRAAAALRSTLPAGAEVSVTLNLQQVQAASDRPEDLAAAAHADLVANRIFLDPMLRGGYPLELLEQTAHLTDWSFVADGDAEVICQPLDFLGVNFYNPVRICAPAAGLAPYPGTDRACFVDIPGPHTVMGWPIQASGLTDLLLRVQRDHGIPMMVTENGTACADLPDGQGVVHDLDRIDYLHQHLTAVRDAIEAGADVRGYYLWTLLDNFEWAWGYDKRFGIVHVDFDTLSRTPKDSARWYADVIARNAPP